MRYLKQFTIILTISLLGEVLHYITPLPVPASIYGLLLMLAALAAIGTIWAALRLRKKGGAVKC